MQRKHRFSVVDYDNIDPITGRERRRWRLAGSDRAEAEQLAARFDRERAESRAPQSPTFLGGFLLETWLPRKKAHVRATTLYRYTWIARHLPHASLGVRKLSPRTNVPAAGSYGARRRSNGYMRALNRLRAQ